MEKNYISEIEDTHFFIKITRKTYGVCINIKDLDRAEEIINYFKETRKRANRSLEKRMATGRRCCLMEECTNLLKEYLSEKRNIDKYVFNIVGTIYRGVNNNRFTLEQALTKLWER